MSRNQPTLFYGDVTPGDLLPDVVRGPYRHRHVALMAAACGDNNPLHFDLELAERSGYPRLLLQGSFIMAAMAHVLYQWEPSIQPVRYRIRMSRPVYMGDPIVCNGTVQQKYMQEDRYLVDCELKAYCEQVQVAAGYATVSIPSSVERGGGFRG